MGSLIIQFESIEYAEAWIWLKMQQVEIVHVVLFIQQRFPGDPHQYFTW
jgi:hypothetical protein